MLKITRRPHERIFLSGGIEIEVLAIKGGRVELGFVAPPAVRIAREEVPGLLERPGERERTV